MPAQRLALTLLALAALVSAGCTSPTDSGTLDTSLPSAGTDDAITPESITGSTGAVGGSVKNSPPTVPTFTSSATEGDNRGGFTVVFTGTIRDANTEAQIKNVSVTGIGPSLISVSHTITADEKSALTEPESFGADGFKVWTGTKNDGILNFKFRHTFAAFALAGTYVFAARAEDTPGGSAVSQTRSILVNAFSDITISPTPVDAAGNALAGQNWGQWEAEAGATNVESSNYVKLVNTGDVATSAVVISFAPIFLGAEDDEFTIPASSNIQFAWAEGSPTAVPSELTFTYGTANPDASTTVTFSGQNNVIYVTYRIVQLPEILPVQSYGISYTVTEL